MEPPVPDALRKHMAKVRRNNRWFWKQCVKTQGLTTSTLVRLSGNFGVENEDQRERLLTALHGRNYQVVAEAPVDSLVEITFEFPAQTWTLAGWNAWTDDMSLLGLGIDFALFGGVKSTHIERDDLAPVDILKMHHRHNNPATWAALRQHGVHAGVPLALDANFWASDQVRAEALATHLRTVLDHTVTVAAPTRTLLRRERRWDVTGTRRAQTTNPDLIDAWTDQMVEVAIETDTEFDGWGSWIPE